MLSNLLQPLKNRDTKIAIIGLGYVGLPLALEFARKFDVLGFDIDARRVAELQEGRDTTREAGVDELRATRARFTADEAELAEADVYIVTVPTPIDEHKRPDLRPLLAASKTIGKYLHPGNVLIYESTVYPGCTEEDCVPILERESGLTCAFEPSEAEGEQNSTKEPKNQRTVLRGLQPGTNQPRRQATPPAEHQESHLRFHARGGRFYRQPLRADHHCRHPQGPEHQGGRGGQSHRKHSARRQHRPGQ